MEIPAFDGGQEMGDSMLEEIRLTAERRLRQIEPLLEEAERLRDVLAALGGRSRSRTEPHVELQRPAPAGEAGGARQAPRLRGSREQVSRSAARKRHAAGTRAAKGSNKRAILALVADRPGITAAEIAQLTGMKRTVVASTVSRLKRYGELNEHQGGGVCVPSGSTESGARQADRRASAGTGASAVSALRERHAA